MEKGRKQLLQTEGESVSQGDSVACPTGFIVCEIRRQDLPIAIPWALCGVLW